MQVTLHAVLSLVSMGICLGVAGLLWDRQDRAGAASLFAFTAVAALWAAGNTIQTASTTLSWKVLSLHVQYIAIAAVPITWFAFAAEYTGHRRWLDRRVLALIALPLALLVLLEWTNGLHGLVRTQVSIITVDGVVHLSRSFGPAFWAGVAYSNLVLGAGTLLLLRGLVRTRRVYKMQVGLIIGGATVPWVANIAYIQGATFIEPEVFYAVTAVAFAIAVTRYQLFDLTPVARSTVLNELPDPIFVLDHATRIVDVNDAASIVTDRPERDVLGLHLSDVLPDTPGLVTDPPDEVTLTGSDGQTRHYAPRITELPDDAGRIVLLRDVTQLTESRRSLERRNSQLEHVADAMSHDLRSPLNVAKGRLALARSKADPDVDEELETVDRAHDRMENIIQSTLRAARATLGDTETEPVNLADACTNAWQTTEVGDRRRVFECENETVEADPEFLVTLLENLFLNAADHGDATEIRVTVTDDGFAVVDDGDGFGDADTDRLLERGYTTSSGGTGLGLAIVRDIAETHGWTIDVGESATGGARFSFGNVELSRQPTESAPRSLRDT